MAFYGAIEQVLTGWIFGLLASDDGTYERAKRNVVETICDGLEAQSARCRPRLPAAMTDNDIVKRLMWSGLRRRASARWPRSSPPSWRP